MSPQPSDSEQSTESESDVETQRAPHTSPESGSPQRETGGQDDGPREPRVRFRSFDMAEPSSETRRMTPDRLEPREDHPREPFQQPSFQRRDESFTSDETMETSSSSSDESPSRESGHIDAVTSAQGLLRVRWAQGAAHRIAARLKRKGDGRTPAAGERGSAEGREIPLSNLKDHRSNDRARKRRDHATATSEAHRLVRQMTRSHPRRRKSRRPRRTESSSSTPIESDPETELPPRGGVGGILSNLLKLYSQQPGSDSSSLKEPQRVDASDQDMDGTRSPGWASPRGDSSDTSTPRKEKLKWYKKPQNQSTTSLGGATSNRSAAGTPTLSSEVMSAAAKRRGIGGKPRLEDEIRVTVQIAEIISRQRYLMQLCEALMKFGAPTHRLEEYMQMTAKVLEVEGQFLYFPGCMIISFDDHSTRTTEVKVLRTAQGVDLGRLAETHDVYKNVVHDLIGVEEATQLLEGIMKKKPKYNVYIIVLVYGLASATIGPFAFEARPIDMPISFILGCLLGVMQHAISPHSSLYSNVFEVTASITTSFLARAIGSIRWGVVDGKQQYLFCFSALAQSSVALILPGFLVLCSSLELQSHQIIAGSIRMVYAIIYSLFLGYGIAVGTTIYGLIDAKANSNTGCPPSPINNQYLQRFPFVIMSALWLVIAHQGKWKQAPVMVFIAICGYVVNFFSTLRLGSNTQVANTIGAFTIGVLGNLYSRIWHGHAATAILPAIFVLVPSGLAATGSLISGVESADQIRGNLTGGSKNPSTGGNMASTTNVTNNAIFNIAFGMVQIAIGITVGLFLAALVVYPYGKRRSGLFSF